MACLQQIDQTEAACLAALTNPDHFNVRDSEEIKTGVEQTIQRFLDVAKQMECFFLQKRLLLSVQKPEHIVLENITELKNELLRKTHLLNKYNEKHQVWQNLLQQEIPGTPRPPPPAVNLQPPQNLPQMQGPPPQQMPPMQVVPQGGAPPGHPHHMMQQHMVPPMTSSPAPNMQGGMMMQSQQMHPQHMAAAQQGGLQGPLAYLERTMSNIGMPDSGR
ncbi:mediator of RNA polymerase II transcription subunit 28-like [Uloborus diversus]|uniref:mediator of RNA polymerase II transcription subunit 28-like n=1 Tax=Uloborus diversus TaxID=327109 RepID=UPI00240A84AF|nr:mediator of RNA polymerase II transcription subunit 28-like [Uloborus diversus]